MARRSVQLAWSEFPPDGGLANVEADLGVRLPAAVRKFYLAELCASIESRGSRGKDAAPTGRGRRVLPELTMDCARLRLYRESAECLLRDSKAEFRLSSSEVVFLVLHDYQFFYFSCADGDDPAVWRFVEGECQPRKVAESFTEWVAPLR